MLLSVVFIIIFTLARSLNNTLTLDLSQSGLSRAFLLATSGIRSVNIKDPSTKHHDC